MQVDIPQITSVSLNSNGNTLDIVYDDGSISSVPFTSHNGTINLGDLSNINTYNSYYTNFTCDSCKNKFDYNAHKGLHYKYIKFERNICKHCLVVALDKLLGLDINGKSEQVLFQK